MYRQPLRKEVIVRARSHSDPVISWVLLIVLYPYLWLFVGYLGFQLSPQSDADDKARPAEHQETEEQISPAPEGQPPPQQLLPGPLHRFGTPP